MNRATRLPLLTVLVALSFSVMVACSETLRSETRGVVPARVHEFEVEFVGTEPVRHMLRVVSGGAPLCGVEFDRIEVERDGNSFVVMVWNTAPDIEVCPSVGSLDHHQIELSDDLEAGAEYTVRVNSLETTFVAQ